MPQFDLTIKSREGIIFSGKVESVTSYNKKGKFDILPTHANFISLIFDKITVRTSSGETKEIAIKNALLRVRQDVVEVYVGIETFGKTNTPINA